jgi:hypothetical protein
MKDGVITPGKESCPQENVFTVHKNYGIVEERSLDTN